MRPTELRHRFRTNLWLLPAAIVLGSAAVAAVLVHVHRWVPPRTLENWPAVFGSGAEGSRAMLTAIAGSMITVAGVVFSITLVTLSLASTQYSPRVLRNFLADRANQSVLGVFVGVFTYCLIVLRSIRGPGEETFVPGVAVFGAIVLAFVAIGFLIFFIHHVATLIQASSILERIADETDRCLDGWVFADDEAEGRRSDAEGGTDGANVPWNPVRSLRRGYVARIDYDRLDRIAARSGCSVRVERGVGEFAFVGQPLVSIARVRGLDEQALREAASAFEIGRQRTAELDPAFGVRQLVDVALKALASGQGDPTTASTAIDYLTAVLARALHSSSSGPAGNGPATRACERPPVRRRGTTCADLVRMSFSEIRQAAHGNLAVLASLARSLEVLEQVADQSRRRDALRIQAEALLEAVNRSDMPAVDRNEISRRVERTVAALR